MAPALILVFFWLRPDVDPQYRVPLLHVYVVTFTAFSATIVSFLLIAALGSVAQPRHLLAAVAFAVMGAMFSVHGLTTPGAIIPSSHPAVPAVSWSAWLTLFSGGVIFAIAGMDRLRGVRRKFLLRFFIAAAIAVMMYISVVVTVPQWLGAIEASAAPWHRRMLFLFSFLVWLLAAVQLFRTWRETHDRIDGTLALVAGLLAQATISMHLFPLWNFSWWFYHFLLLGSFMITTYVLFTAYEQARAFRLIRYFMAAALILTALLALVASFLFSQFAERILTDEITVTVQAALETFVASAGTELPAEATLEEVSRIYGKRLDALPVETAAVYDLQGQRLYDSGSQSSYYAGGAYSDLWQRVLDGEPVVNIRAPGESAGPGSAYGGEASGNHQVFGYVAVGNGTEPLGVLVTRSEIPNLTQTIMRARYTGLLIAAVTMGLLFTVLWLVVRRADGIIVARSQELAIAYEQLRQAEAMRDDLTHMVVHDLRTPLTAILASMGLLKRAGAAGKAEYYERVVDRTNRAAQRLDQMIDDILKVSKIETGELKPRREPVLVSQLMTEQMDPYFMQASAEEKILNVDCPPELDACIDPALTARVLENLVSNALKYTARGGHITVSAQGQNGTLCMSVRDDGEGIPDDFKDQIFCKFSMVPQLTGRPIRKGTGLGLAFCRLAVEAHGGKIWVEDTPGGGSDFKMQMPAFHDVVATK